MDAEWDDFQAAGEAALAEGDYAAAEVIWRAAYQKARAFKKYDARVTTTLEALSEALWHQEKYHDAELLCRHTLSIFEVTRGVKHHDYGVCCNNLAMLLHRQGKYAEAEPLYKKAREILSRTLGSDHPNVSAMLTKYSELLQTMGRQSEAEQINNEALTTSTLTRSGQYEALETFTADQLMPEPTDRPSALPVDTWEALRVDAWKAADAQDFARAETLWQEAIKMSQSFVAQDARLPVSLEGLAEVFWRQGKFELAEPLCKRCLNIYESVLGVDHDDVGVIANNLAMLYHAQDKLVEAEVMYKRALPIRVRALGIHHPIAYNLLTNYANVLMVQGRQAEAEQLKAQFADTVSGHWARSETTGNGQSQSSEVAESSSSEDLPILSEPKP